MSLPQLSQLLPLPEDELRQVLDYATSLSKTEAASHLSNLLGDSPLAVDFISSFNARRETPAAATATATSPADTASPPRSKRAPSKKKPPLHTPQARVVDSYAGPAATAYNKRKTDLEYISQRPNAPTDKHVSRPDSPPVASGSSSAAAAGPASSAAQPPKQTPKQHASSTGFLISETLGRSKSNKSGSSTRSSTPKPSSRSDNTTTKISISGGTPMAGQSTALADLDDAIRALEVSTNPSLDNPAARRCHCVATRHPLQTAAPNCLSCGKVVCVKEGLGPCTHCGAALLSTDDVQAMVRELRDERGRERMAAHASINRRRADASQTAAPATFSRPRGNFGTAAVDVGPSLAEAAAKAREHRDKLLGFQSQNAKRTTVHDEASDFDVSAAVTGGAGAGSMWASPEERARELKRQQKILREMEWQARPEYEKRQQVMSIDLVNGRVVRNMVSAKRAPTPDNDDNDDEHEREEEIIILSHGAGAFSNNPLLGALLKPVFKPMVAKAKNRATFDKAGGDGDGDGQAFSGDGDSKDAARARREQRKGWRRVQDDQDDNEDMILDGGIHGHAGDQVAGDEPGVG